MNTVIEAVKGIHGGCFTRVRYKSEMPLKSIYKKNGWKIEKFTSVTVRIGVDYEHIKSVIERKLNPDYVPKQTTNNYSWVIPNRIAYNSNTKAYYLRVATAENNYRKIRYAVTDDKGNVVYLDKLTEEYEQLLLDSYINKKSPVSEVMNIKLENILGINGEVFA